MELKDKEKTTISVILPVYNVEPWLDDCIESLKQQKLPGLEFIFVDDCSTDGSLAKIEFFAAEDPRVIILHNEVNSGSGPSRNRGIEAAKGEYLSFIDPDDWISDDFYELLYKKAKETGSDIAKGRKITVEDRCFEKKLYNKQHHSVINKRIRQKKHRHLYNRFTSEHQTAIYKETLFHDRSIRYGSSRVAQDTTFLFKITSSTESISTQDSAVYYYRRRIGSATYTYTLTRSMAQLDSLEERVRFLKSKPHSNGITDYLRKYIRYYLSTFYYATQADTVSEEDRKNYKSRLISILTDSGAPSDIMRDFAELSVYTADGFVIPVYKNINNPADLSPLKRWTEYLIDKCNNAEKECIRGYSVALIRALHSSLRTIAANPRKGLDGLKLSVRQLLRLDFTVGLKVIISVPAVCINLMINKLR